MAVLILLMVSTIVATGMPAAREAYQKVVLTANAQTLLSTAVNALRDEIGTAWDVREETISDVKYLTYMSADTGARSRLFVEDGEIMLEENSALAELGIEGQSATKRPLVKDGNSNGSSNLVVSYDSAELSDDGKNVLIKGLKVSLKDDDPLVQLEEVLSIRVF